MKPSTQTQTAAEALATAANAMRGAVERNASQVIRVSYYPTLLQRYKEFCATKPELAHRVIAAAIVQRLEAAAFGECFTYTPDETTKE